MQLNEVGFVFHKNLGAVEIDRACVALQAQNPDGSTAFVKHEGEIKEVTRSLLVSADSVEAIAEEMKELRWQRVEPPIWWEEIGDFIIADGHLGTTRAHMVRGHVEPGRVVKNAHIIGQADWPNALYSETLSHLSQWITRKDNHYEGYRGAEDDPRAIRWATRMLARDFSPDWTKWHYTEGSGMFTACDVPVQTFTMDGSPQDGQLFRINCKKCLAAMRKNGLGLSEANT